MQDSTRIPDVLVIGAGLAGLLAARAARERGLSVRLIDKGRSPGGRMATRRIGPGRADTGAQFFTVRSPEFAREVSAWTEQGWVSEWSRGWRADGDGHPRYRATDGFAALAKRLAVPLAVMVDRRVTGLRPREGGWSVETDPAEPVSARAVILTAPVPQAVDLLEHSGLAVPEELRAVHYAPCLAGLFHIDGGAGLPEPGAVQQVSERVSWVSDNQRKGISPDARLLTVHASPIFSAEAYGQTDDAVLATLWQEVAPLCRGARQLSHQLKRWRYAQPVHTHPAPALALWEDPPLIVAGDGFGAGRLEGAAQSGWAAADMLAG